MFASNLFAGKTILVTGGGTGLGKEIATRYLQLGAEVWIAGRRGAVLDSCSKVVNRKIPGGTVRTHAVDIRARAGGGCDGPAHLGRSRPAHRPGE